MTEEPDVGESDEVSLTCVPVGLCVRGESIGVRDVGGDLATRRLPSDNNLPAVAT